MTGEFDTTAANTQMDLKIIVLALALFISARANPLTESFEDDRAACKVKVTFPVTASGLKALGYPWKTTVFGIPLYFAEKYKTNKKINYVSSILAELLDQDQDGCADDSKILAQLLKVKSIESMKMTYALLFPNKITDFNGNVEEKFNMKNILVGQTVGEDECKPKNALFSPGKRDATIEEVFHFITTKGYQVVYPKIFGTKFGANSNLTRALDNARKLKVAPTATSLPPVWTKTPSGTITSAAQKKGWFYSYNDPSCIYNCQSDEYLWQGYCSYSGICAGIALGTKAEFHYDQGGYKYQTKEQFKKDPMLRKVFLKSGTGTYTLPTKPVDGTYTGCKKCTGGISHGGK